MNKSELVDHVALQLRSSKAAAERTVDAVIGGMGKGLKKEKSLTITGFGTFMVRNRKARMGRNPQTGAPIQIKASKTVGFRAGKGLKDSI